MKMRTTVEAKRILHQTKLVQTKNRVQCSFIRLYRNVVNNLCYVWVFECCLCVCNANDDNGKPNDKLGNRKWVFFWLRETKFFGQMDRKYMQRNDIFQQKKRETKKTPSVLSRCCYRHHHSLRLCVCCRLHIRFHFVCFIPSLVLNSVSTGITYVYFSKAIQSVVSEQRAAAHLNEAQLNRDR